MKEISATQFFLHTFFDIFAKGFTLQKKYDIIRQKILCYPVHKKHKEF